MGTRVRRISGAIAAGTVMFCTAVPAGAAVAPISFAPAVNSPTGGLGSWAWRPDDGHR